MGDFAAFPVEVFRVDIAAPARKLPDSVIAIATFTKYCAART
jgi:hypothetical protein